MLRSLSLGLSLLSLVACTANIPDGRFRCTDVGGCPNGLTCGSDRLCYHPGAGPDGGPAGGDTGLDAPATDGGRLDGGPPPPCTGASCITFTITNAHSRVIADQPIMIETWPTTMPAFGDTTDPITISLGDNGKLDVTSVVGTQSFTLMGHTSYALVVGVSADGDPTMPQLRALAASGVAPATGNFNLYPIDMMQETDPLAISDPAMSPTPTRGLAPGAAGDPGVLFIPQGSRTPIALWRTDASGAVLGVMLAAFDASELPQTGSYYVALVGRTDVHLGADNGLRAIPIVPGHHIVEPQPVVWMLNGTDGTILACDTAGNLITTIPSFTLAEPIPSFDPLTPAGVGRTIRFADGRTSLSCPMVADPMHDINVPPMMGAPHVPGRSLLAVEGLLDMSWGGGAGLEAPPSAGTPAQVVTYANGLIGGSMQFGSTASGATALAMAISTVTIEWPMRPSDLLVRFGTPVMMRHFDWVPTTPVATTFVEGDGTMFVALEMDAAFGQPWVLHVAPQLSP
jgi:hypothetical protein